MTPADDRPADVPARPLVAGEPQSGNFDDDTPHAYTVEVAAGDLLRVTAEQLGADVRAVLFAPDGRRVMAMDSPTGSKGPETVCEVAQRAGVYRVEVHPFDQGPGAGYEIRIDDLRPAGDDDRRLVDADQTFARGEELRQDDAFARAEHHYREALAVFRELGTRRREAHAVHRIGMTHLRRGQSREAKERFRLAAERFRALGDAEWEVAALNRLGSLLRREGNLPEALASHRRTVELARHLDDPVRLATSLDLLGDVYRWSQHFDQAHDAYREALELWTAEEKTTETAATWIRLGELYLGQNRLEDARDALERARDLAGETRADLLSRIDTHLGNVAFREGRLEAAREHTEGALAMAEEIGDARARAVAHGTLGSLALEQGRLDEAERHLRAASELAAELEDAAMEGWLLHKMGRVRFAARELAATPGPDAAPELDEALELHRRADAIFKRVGDRQGVAATRYAIARIHHRRGDFVEARKVLESTLRSADELRGDAESPDLQTSWVDSKHHYWELFVDTLMRLQEKGHQGSADLALAVTESWRARGLVEMLERAGVDMERGVDDRLLERREAIQRQLNAVELRAMELLGSDPAKRREVERERVELLRELRHVRSEIRRSGEVQKRLNPASDLAVLRSSAVPDVQQWHLGARTAILVYSLGEERSFAWTVTVRDVRHHVLPPRREIEELARTASELLRSAAASRAERRRKVTEALSDQVLAPLIADLEAQEEEREEEDTERGTTFTRLFVVPDGGLLHVPFAALPLPARPDGDDAGPDAASGHAQRPPLLTRYEVARLPSIATLLSLRETAHRRRESDRRAPRAAAVVADPVYGADDPRLSDAGGAAGDLPPDIAGPLTRAARDTGREGFQRLPGTAREAQVISELMPENGHDDVLLATAFDADRQMVLDGRLADYRILHFATHGVANSTHPDLSGLVLSLYDSRGRPRDGFLRLHEIYDLHLPAELVVLSACETGLGRAYRGEGMVGLTRGFMYAGATRVVVSLWKVDDESTAELMWRFYHEMLVERQPPAAALRGAQASMRADPEWAAPYHWAGFVFLGDPSLARSLGNPIEKAETGADEPPDTRLDDQLPIPEIPPRPSELGGGDTP